MAEKEGVMTDENWEGIWAQEGDPNYHLSNVHRFLHDHFEKVTKGAKNLNVFVPLCGKSVDMKWLSDLGHTVVGVELVAAPVEAFFEENNIEFSTEITADGMKVCTSCDGKIKIYVGDMFKLSREVLGAFDVIWDRGSLVALNAEDRDRYISLLSTLFASGGRVLLATIEYDTDKHPGPPHVIREDKVKELFGSGYHVEFLDSWDLLSFAEPEWGLDWFVEKLSVIVKESDRG